MRFLEKYIIQEGQIIPAFIEEKYKYQFEYNDIEKIGMNFYCKFTGFIIGEKSILISFPKHYFDEEKLIELNHSKSDIDLMHHMNLLFNTISKALLKKSERAIGIKEDINAQYPFTSFFNIYNYYQSYGLYINEVDRYKFNYSGKINWKKTIERSPIVINERNLLYLPLIVEEKAAEHVFITKCMAYAIDSTIEKFKVFLKLEKTNFELSGVSFDNPRLIVNQLREIGHNMFKDIDKNLIKDLIDFYQKISMSSHQVQIKMHTFNLLWEDMVEEYLNKYFSHIDHTDGEIQLVFTANINEKKYNFKKEIFYPDIRKEKGYRIEPDHFSNYQGDLYLFDSKYYNEVKGLDYKQVSYYYLLFNRKEHLNTERIYSALILPTEKSSTKVASKEHFIFNESFSIKNAKADETSSGFVIFECYLDIQDVMSKY